MGSEIVVKNIPSIKLNNGMSMPVFGLGTYLVSCLLKTLYL